MRLVPLTLTGLVVATIATAAIFQQEHRHAIAREAAHWTGGEPQRGRDLVRRYGCAACHDVPGFAGTVSHVGPPLTAFGQRMFIAGVAENKPENLIRFLQQPRALVPQGAMPNLGVTDADARDLAAFLYTLR